MTVPRPFLSRASTTATTRALALAGSAAAVALLITGCSSTPAPAPTVTVTETATAAPEPAPSPTDDTPTLSGTAFNFDCSAFDALGTAAAVDSDYVPATEWAPAPGSSAANISAINGVDCAWVTPDDELVIGLAIPDAPTLTYYEQYISGESDPTSDFGADLNQSGYFSVSGGVGQADVFTESGYWVSISAPQFASPTDVGPTLAAVLQTLPNG